VEAYKALEPNHAFETVNVPKKVRVVALNNDYQRCAFAIECKQEKKPLSGSRVINIVTGKLRDNMQRYPLLFIFALGFGTTVSGVKVNGCSFWELKGNPPNSFRLVRLSEVGREKTCVVLISLKVVWGHVNYALNENDLSKAFY
jgi:hypothetical protein